MDDAGVTVNGVRRALNGAAVHTTTLDWLRAAGLSGSKEGCAEGECGACAVLLAMPSADGGSTWTAVNSCLMPVYALNGQEVVTAEGLGSPDALHPVQRELAEGGGSQCGYCTPGFACSMAAEYYRPDRRPLPDADEVGAPGPQRGLNGFDLHAISGNLCRCTGYRPIRDASFGLGMPESGDPLAERREHPAPGPVPTRAQSGAARFVRPATLAETLALLRDEPDVQLVAGGTDWGVDVNLRGARAPFVVAIERLAELRTLTADDDQIEIGAGLTLTELDQRLDGRVPLLAQLLPQFASPLIRNRATVGGNLGTGSPIGDASPALLALDARVVLASVEGERTVDLAEYFTAYRRSVRRPDELIRAVQIPLPLAPVTWFHKVAKRRIDDISSVALAFALDIDDGVVTRARVGVGGAAATPIRALATEDQLIGRPWTIATVRAAALALGAEGTPMSDHRASAEYRALMMSHALLKMYAANGIRGVDQLRQESA